MSAAPLLALNAESARLPQAAPSPLGLEASGKHGLRRSGDGSPETSFFATCLRGIQAAAEWPRVWLTVRRPAFDAPALLMQQ
jgi:hypothetical protein